MTDAYFITDDDWFVPTHHCRGPWSPDNCHAGPPTGLLARAMEQALTGAGSDQRLVRLCVELTRPVPMAGFRIGAGVVRSGRSVTTLRASLCDGEDRERIVATGLALRADLNRPLPTPSAIVAELDEAAPGGFPITRSLHKEPSFIGSVSLQYPPGEHSGPGPTTVWMCSVPLLAGETPSPFQRICPLADCGNAFSRNAEPWDVSFVNPDLTVVLHREPEGEWLGSRSVSHWQPSGIGLAEAVLFDHKGAVGHALQTLLLTLNPSSS